MTILIWTIFAFISGSIPFSVLVGRVALRSDIRHYGDHNPGATNVVRAGGMGWGVLAAILDMLKGGIPVGLAWYFGGVSDWALVPVMLAPVLGHAFSPFLHFRGGKAIAATGGVWGGLTYGLATAALAAFLFVGYLFLKLDGWAVLFGMVAFLVVLLMLGSHPSLYAVWIGNFLILAYKHRDDLTKMPGLRPWLRRVVG